jgi:hypothetical protein
MAAPDPGLSNYGASMPCWTRRMIIESGGGATLPDHGMFPLDGQFIDTPAGWTPRKTSDTPS